MLKATTYASLRILFSCGAIACFAGSPAVAQNASMFSSGNMWGTTSGIGVNGASESAGSHVLNGTIASQVNSARRGNLISGSNTIQTIGSQTVINTSIMGDDNGEVRINAEQNSSNSGEVRSQNTFNNRPRTTNRSTSASFGNVD